MCHYRLGLFQEAIRQFELSLALHPTDETVLHLNKAYLRIDQPLVAAKMFRDLAEQKPGAALAVHACALRFHTLSITSPASV